MRSRPKFKAGLQTLVRDGATFPTARYDYAETVTAAGHTTLATGANPSRHGVNSNKILNRTTGKLERIFADSNHPVLEAPLSSDDVSPVNLLAETLSDRLRLSTQSRGKSISIGGKARSAIALGGHLGEAWWFSEEVGKFVTGTYYRKEFPAWVKAFNDKKLPDTYFAKEWALAEPVKEYIGDDDRTGESDWYALGKKFPHPLTGGLAQAGPQSYSALASSPMFNEIQVAFAKAAIDAEGLGKDDIPDLLSISFSALDRTYHLWGPYSWEMQDHVMRLDKAIGELITAAEKAAGGRANLLVVLSADHGGANIPEQWAALGVDGVRVSPTTLEKALVFLDDKLLGATSNAVERANRRFRKAQKSIYSVRTKSHLEERLALDSKRPARGQMAAIGSGSPAGTAGVMAAKANEGMPSGAGENQWTNPSVAPKQGAPNPVGVSPPALGG